MPDKETLREVEAINQRLNNIIERGGSASVIEGTSFLLKLADRLAAAERAVEELRAEATCPCAKCYPALSEYDRVARGGKP